VAARVIILGDISQKHYGCGKYNPRNIIKNNEISKTEGG
jgi:hypothetical protein